mmetsp:Transcript_20157/g.29638  ORF Transcript_20157/g.29638 Transcript_20157/m.29638 type:complete len:178 (-) Transcript_20157:113-646(-)
MSSSKMPKMDMSDLKGSSLMNRLGNFLPKMAAANEELDKTLAHYASSSLNVANGKGESRKNLNPLQIDAELKKESVDEDGESEYSDDQSVGDEQQQTIEMTVALGDFDSNPVMSALCGSGDDDGEKSDDNGEEESSGAEQKTTILMPGRIDTSTLKKSLENESESPFLSVRSTRRKS